MEAVALMVIEVETRSSGMASKSAAFLKAMETSEFRTLAESLHLYEEKPLTGQKLKEYIEGGYAKNGEVIRKAKLSK